METFQIVVFFLLLIDSVVVNILAWGSGEWYIKHFQTISRYFPITKVWAAWYLILVLWIGLLTF